MNQKLTPQSRPRQLWPGNAGRMLAVVLFLGVRPVCGFSHMQATPSLQSEVEHGLSQRVRIEGRPLKHWKIEERMRHYGVPGMQIVVIHKDRVDWSAAYGVLESGGPRLVDDQTLFQCASVSKVITALAVLRMVNMHRFSLDADADTLLKSWHFPAHSKPVTVRELLSHNAAINWPAGESALPPDGPLPSNVDRLSGRSPALNRPVIVDGTPGLRFRYSNGGYLVLGQIVSDVSGSDFARTARELVFNPLGMHRSIFEVMTSAHADSNLARGHTEEGTEESGGWRVVGMPEGGLWTTASDLARAVLAIQKSAASEGGFLSKNLAGEMLTKQDEQWGLGVQLERTGDDARFQHDGSTPGYKARLLGYSHRGQGVVILTNGERGGELIDEVIYSVAAVYQWPDFQVATRTVIAVSPATLNDYVGRYQMAPGAYATISNEAGKLFAEVRGRQKTELMPEAHDRFFMLEGPIVQFVRSEDGSVTELIFDGSFHARRVPSDR